MPDLFPALPVQRAPRILTTDRHALIPCDACGGTGEGEPNGCEEFWPCGECSGAGAVLRRVGVK